jgi:tetratricopeptide (TPR) repeat protein
MNGSIKFVWMLLIIMISGQTVFSQVDFLTDSLKKSLESATTDRDKISILGKLASSYMVRDEAVSEAYGKKQILIAELSRDRKLMVMALLSNGRRHMNMSGVQTHVNTAIDYYQQALTIARNNNLEMEMVQAYLFLSKSARTNADIEKALSYSTQAFAVISGVKDDGLKSMQDSLKVECYLTMGTNYLIKNERLLAFKNYLNALDIAEITKRKELLNSCYSKMSDFYAELNDYDKAIDNYSKILKNNLADKNNYDLLDDYNNIGKIYTAKKSYDIATSYYEKAIQLADSLKNPDYKITSYLHIVNQYFASEQYQKGIDYLKSNKPLLSFFEKNNLMHFIDQGYGNVYSEMGKLDSADFYLKRALPYYDKNVTNSNKIYFYVAYGKLLSRKGQHPKAIDYLMQSKTLAAGIGNLDILKNITNEIDSAYQRAGDFKNAYVYRTLYDKYKDSIQELSKEKDLVSLEVDNENRRKERLAKAAIDEANRRHNIQYLGITAGIAGVFVLLVMIGLFSVSVRTIRVLGFFSFIFLFEFIILLADNKIHHLTHGEPWKILLIKIVLIAILMPLHHYLEHKVIHYLNTHKKISLDKQSWFGKLFRRKDSNHPANNT